MKKDYQALGKFYEELTDHEPIDLVVPDKPTVDSVLGFWMLHNGYYIPGQEDDSAVHIYNYSSLRDTIFNGVKDMREDIYEKIKSYSDNGKIVLEDGFLEALAKEKSIMPTDKEVVAEFDKENFIIMGFDDLGLEHCMNAEDIFSMIECGHPAYSEENVKIVVDRLRACLKLPEDFSWDWENFSTIVPLFEKYTPELVEIIEEVFYSRGE